MLFESKPEKILYEALKKAGIDTIPNFPIPRKLRLDMKIRGKLIDIEVDGVYWHRGKRLIKDQQRDYVLRNKGYTILRFTDLQVLNNIEEVIKTVKEVNEKWKKNE